MSSGLQISPQNQKNFPLPAMVIATCISFVLGDINNIMRVNKLFLTSSDTACKCALASYKAEDPLLKAIITSLSPESSIYALPFAKTLIKLHYIVISRARGASFKISNPLTIHPLEFVEEIKAHNFNLFFHSLLLEFFKLEQQKVLSLEKTLKEAGSPLKKAALGRQWMKDNPQLLKCVTRLRLDKLGLSSLPSEIGLLTNIEKLYLDKNQLTFLPSEISWLTKLTYLCLSSNRFTALPSEIGSLTNIQELHLNNNQLTFLPPEVIGSLTNLRSLCLSDNQITSVSPEMSALTNIEELYLDNNRLTDLPKEFRRLVNLKHFLLAGNFLDSSQPIINYLQSQLKDCHFVLHW